jgi:hypothetical protein
MRRALVVCHGYLGDHIFASSIAKKLKEENQFDVVDYVVGFPQVIPFLELDPYIDQVMFFGQVTPTPRALAGYDKTIQLGPLSFIEPPCVEFQKLADVQNPTPDFIVHTDKDIDRETTERFATVRSTGTPIIAIMDNWQPKAFGFTREEYNAGVNVPYLGYGGRLRNIPMIVSALQERFVTIMVGAPEGVTQFDTASGKYHAQRSLLEEASVLRQCDYFVGAEGGLANIAAGVGCKTILTSDFVWQLYGANGVIRKIDEPKLGPRYYFPSGHIDLDPYLTDDEVAATLISLIQPDHD